MTNDLTEARKNKNDEFYTLYEDIKKEMSNYSHHFENKTIYLCCDDGTKSNFWKFFNDYFDKYKIRKIIATGYHAKYYERTSEGVIEKELKEDGDFRSEECYKIFEEADVVITNPPFSLFREFISLLERLEKKYIVWGTVNAITYKNIFPLIKERKMWTGSIFNKTCLFRIPNSYEIYDEKNTKKKNDGNKYGSVPSITVFTNLEWNKKFNDKYTVKFDAAKYPRYDNYDAIDCKFVKKIPVDYTEMFGVPITFIDKYNPEQFEIIGIDTDKHLVGHRTKINGKTQYARIFIKWKARS